MPLCGSKKIVKYLLIAKHKKAKMLNAQFPTLNSQRSILITQFSQLIFYVVYNQKSQPKKLNTNPTEANYSSCYGMHIAFNDIGFRKKFTSIQD